MTAHPVAFRLDGQHRTFSVPAATTLAELIGRPIGCGEGVCGACTVMVDGVAVRSCLLLAAQAQDAEVLTVASLPAIEGAATEGGLTPLQRAFSACRTFQCGWCVPGMLVGTAAFLRRCPHPTRADLAAHFVGHLCRCVAGVGVIEAVLALCNGGEVAP